jgi:hypothetical protein
MQSGVGDEVKLKASGIPISSIYPASGVICMINLDRVHVRFLWDRYAYGSERPDSLLLENGF